MKTVFSRADLLRILGEAPDKTLDAVAGELGFERTNIPGKQRQESEAEETVPTDNREQASSVDFEKPTLKALAPVPFWRQVSYKWTGDFEQKSRQVSPENWRILEEHAPEQEPITPWTNLLPKLRQAMAQPRVQKALDMRSITRRLTRGQALVRLPRRKRKKWPKHIHILEDCAERLIPLTFDQDYVQEEMTRLLPGEGIQKTRLDDGIDKQPLRGTLPIEHHGGLHASTYLVLGDLGILGCNGMQALESWRRFARMRQAEGAVCIALTPAPLEAYPEDFKRLWRLVPWEDQSGSLSWDKTIRREHARILLGLLSFVPKIAPGLLREVRRNFTDFSVITECDLWRLPEIAVPSSIALVAEKEAKESLRKYFYNRTPGEQKQIFKTVRRWFTGEDSLYYEAVISLGASARDVVVSDDVDAALNFVQIIAHAIGGKVNEIKGSDLTPRQVADYVKGFRARTSDRAQNFSEVRKIYTELCQDMEKAGLGGGYAAGADPEPLAPLQSEPETINLMQRADQITAVSGLPASGSPLAQIMTRNSEFFLWEASFWASGQPPQWASSWGEDEYGPWVEISYPVNSGQSVNQRLRWVGPGSFLMGSPETEEGRDGADTDWNEGPQHRVTLTKGYWLFDTPVTQGLWQAVMENNPSRFKSDGRPVERVSWDDAQTFLERINNKLPDLDLTLPTEAQWEYACRAGTDTATYAGPMKIEGEHTAPVLDAIAWYGGNSGVEFDLEEGGDTSGWKEKQYNHSKAGTRIVGLKKPNGWGLYDMLGNVWEWCDDGMRAYDTSPEFNPVGALDSSKRVLRGGSWSAYARNVRAATRLQNVRDYRNYDVGFRCARVQDGAEPIDLWQSGQAERPRATDRIGGAERFIVTGDQQEKSTRLPQSPFVIRSDCETLTFSSLSKPGWANAIGRDGFGLWVDIAIENIKQRLRWVGPGSFLMGSPDSEEGRLGEGSDWNEGPQHRVTLTKGYWLFDTPVTQGLWQVVMENNPSRFKSEGRPVERVSWDDAQTFLERINYSVPDLDLRLPTEAQWEYACRAGTDTSTYAGSMKIAGERNAPVLDTIAWYGGNSGVEFDLEDGEHSSGWKGKQYEHSKAGTRIVGLKEPNRWGLYDMLGNVLEWCDDGMRAYEPPPEFDPTGPLDSASRVLRGGSWDDCARVVRAAARCQYERGGRSYDLGFRCARVHE